MNCIAINNLWSVLWILRLYTNIKFLTTLLAYPFKHLIHSYTSLNDFYLFSYHVEHIIIMKLIFLTHPHELEHESFLMHDFLIKARKKQKRKTFNSLLDETHSDVCSIGFRGTMRWNNCTLIFHFPPIVFTFSCVFIQQSARSSHFMSCPDGSLFSLFCVHVCTRIILNKSSRFCD